MSVHSTAGYAQVGTLARGGMGEVALGMRETGTFRRLVAIKRLRPEFRDDESVVSMFLAEARLAGLIRHPNVVGVLDVGSDEDGPYLIMDYVEGIDVHRLLRYASKARSELPVQVVLQILQQTALGLAAAHELRATDGEPMNLVHRDVSPQNILLGYDGLVRLTDFGIAKAKGSDKTSTGLLKGKMGYMSPEQLQFEHPTQKSDLFSLGVVLFELVTARRLYKAEDNVAVAKKILRSPVPDVTEFRKGLPAPVVELCTTLLQKDPDARSQDAREVATIAGRIGDELAVAEGRVRLADFLAQHFGPEREDERARTEGMVREWESSRSIRMARVDPEPEPTRPRRWPIAVGATLVLGALAAGGVVVITDTPPLPTVTPLPVAAPIAEPAPPAEPETIEPEVVEPEAPTDALEEPETEEPSAVVAEEAPDEADEASADEPSTTTPVQPRRRRTRRRPSMAASMTFDALDLIERTR